MPAFHPVEFDEERYLYLGHRWNELHDPERCDDTWDAVLRGDGTGRVVRGGNRNQAVRFPNGDIDIVPGARLRRKDTYEAEA